MMESLKQPSLATYDMSGCLGSIFCPKTSARATCEVSFTLAELILIIQHRSEHLKGQRYTDKV